MINVGLLQKTPQIGWDFCSPVPHEEKYKSDYNRNPAIAVAWKIKIKN